MSYRGSEDSLNAEIGRLLAERDRLRRYVAFLKGEWLWWAVLVLVRVLPAVGACLLVAYGPPDPPSTRVDSCIAPHVERVDNVSFTLHGFFVFFTSSGEPIYRFTDFYILSDANEMCDPPAGLHDDAR